MTDKSVADGSYVPTEIDLTAQRRCVELLKRLTHRNGPTVDSQKVADAIQRLLDEPKPRDTAPFTLDDFIQYHMDVLGIRLSNDVLKTGTIIRFRHLVQYTAYDLLTIRHVGRVGVRKIEQALASVDASLKSPHASDSQDENRRRVIPSGKREHAMPYAWVPLGEHEDITLHTIWFWLGLGRFPARAVPDPRLQTFGDLLKLSRQQLEDIIFDWIEDQFESYNDARDRKTAVDIVDKLKAYVTETLIPWPAFHLESNT